MFPLSRRLLPKEASLLNKLNRLWHFQPVAATTALRLVFSSNPSVSAFTLTTSAAYWQLTMAASKSNNVDLKKIGQNFVKEVPTLETRVKMESFWADSPAVIIFLRRFGQAAKEISLLLPLLKQNNVRLIAIGLEEFGMEEFIEGKFFDGELYIDVDEASYKAMGYKRFNLCTVIMSLFNKKARAAIAKGREDRIPNNLKGNGLQNGGVLIVSKGGSPILMDFRQDNPADHAENSDILKALGIKDTQGLTSGSRSSLENDGDRRKSE